MKWNETEKSLLCIKSTEKWAASRLTRALGILVTTYELGSLEQVK